MRRALLVLLTTAAVSAFPGTPNPRTQAMRRASLFLSSRGKKDIQLTLAHQGRPAGRQQDTDEACYYVFNQPGEKGFVIITGDDGGEVLGYADHGHFDTSLIPDNMQVLLDSYAEEISQARTAATTSPSDDVKNTSWQVVLPLLTSNWNQKYPYNLLSPTISGKQTPTGCVATALAQVMYYHKWPLKSTTEIPAYGSLPALPPTTFDWASMTDSYPNSDDLDDTSNLAVATLMQYCGRAAKTTYGSSASSAPTAALCDILHHCFGYNGQAREVCRNNYGAVEWERLIHSELTAGRPVFFSAQSSGAVHAFVCDGYDGNGLFHINWGWGGLANGYFKLQALNPTSQGVGGSTGCGGYSINQHALVGVSPWEVEREPLPSCSGIATNNISLVNSSGEKTTKGTYTYDNSAGLANAKVYYSFSQAGLANSYDIAIGLYNSEGRLLGMKPMGNYSLSSVKTTIDSTFTLAGLGKGLGDGAYTIRGIDRNGSSGEWFPNLNSENNYLKVVKSNGKYTITTTKVTTIPDLEVPEAKQTFQRGVSPLCVTAHVRNKGESEVNTRLYLYMNTSCVAYEQVYLPPGGEDDVEFYFYRQTLTNKMQISTGAGPSNVLYCEEEFTLTKTNPTPKLTMVSSQVKNTEGNYLYGSLIEGSATFNNTSDKDYDTFITVQLQKPTPSGSWAAYNINIPTKIPAGETGTVDYTFPIRVDEKFNIKIFNCITSFITIGAKTVKPGVITWTADGERQATAPTQTIEIPSNAAAVSLEELGLLEAYTIKPNNNPNTLYYIAPEASIPSVLKGKNVVRGHEAETFHLVDGHGYHVPKNFHTDKANYTRTPTLACNTHVGWQTITLPFAVQNVISNGKAIPRLKEKDGDTPGYWLWEFSGDNGHTVTFADATTWTPNTPRIIGTTDHCKDKPLMLNATNAMVLASPACSVASKNYRFASNVGDNAVSGGYVMNSTGSAFRRASKASVRAGEACFTTSLPAATAPALMLINGLVGDTNDDGMLTVADVSLSIEHILQKNITNFMEANADINGDGSITISDVTATVEIIINE